MHKYAAIGRKVYKCPDCILVPSEYYREEGKRSNWPTIDRAFDAGRKWWTLPCGTMMMGEITFPIHSDFIPCDKHVTMLDTLESTEGE